MAAEDLRFRAFDIGSDNREVESSASFPSSLAGAASATSTSRREEGAAGGGDAKVTCFTEVVDDITLNFQIIRFPKQIYAWIGCNSAKFGNMYAAAPTRPNNAVSVASLLGGTSDNTSSGIARHLVLKTGLGIILASNIPKNSPMLEANAERKLVEKLIELGYAQKRTEGLAS